MMQVDKEAQKGKTKDDYEADFRACIILGAHLGFRCYYILYPFAFHDTIFDKIAHPNSKLL